MNCVIILCNISHYIISLLHCFQLVLKEQTSAMFKGKKENYPGSVCRPFLDTRISKTAVNFLSLRLINGFAQDLPCFLFYVQLQELIDNEIES